MRRSSVVQALMASGFASRSLRRQPIKMATLFESTELIIYKDVNISSGWIWWVDFGGDDGWTLAFYWTVRSLAETSKLGDMLCTKVKMTAYHADRDHFTGFV